ncbi:Ltp family lipoprotein [Oceanobacillus sp. AG]|uniref:Ltp family lipoprotein n=1 Tax=Oceanobacillus sp. AG TaxID=2681969 RepID=UPI0012EB6E3B|nr:Ltp family lipoprotein [Oceanobacillus sp. AG]
MRKLSVFILSLLIAFVLAACGETESGESNQSDDNADAEESLSEDNEDENVEENPEEVEEVEAEAKTEPEPEEADVPREYQNALQAAQNYIDLMHFSEKGLFEQLTSEYGDQYPEDAAQYANTFPFFSPPFSFESLVHS